MDSVKFYSRLYTKLIIHFLSLRQLVMEYCLGSASDLIEGKQMKTQAVASLPALCKFFFFFLATNPAENLIWFGFLFFFCLAH